MKRFYSWNEYYQDRKANISNLLLHWQYLLKVVIARPKKLLEIGCGSAEHSLFVKKVLPSTKVYLLDLDRKLLQKVIDNHPGIVTDHYIADVTSPSSISKLHLEPMDIAISQGLMEHFPDKEFIKVIENIRKITSNYLFSVPSNLYPTIDYGNEILRSSEQMRELLSVIPKIRYKVSPYIDIGLRTKFVALKTKKMSTISLIKYLLTGSSHLLIEIKYLAK